MSQKKPSHSSEVPKEQLSEALYDVHNLLDTFWPSQLQKVETLPSSAFRDQHHAQELPLARIKKIMKLDDEVRNQMISAEAPVLFAKAAEMFIEELTLRSWVHTEDNKRKTLQKNDIAMAITKYDQFDFLIDIVPREEIKTTTTSSTKKPTNDVQFSTLHVGQGATTVLTAPTTPQVDRQQYFLQTVPVHNGTAVPGATTLPQTLQLQNAQLVQTATPLAQPVQLVSGPNGELQVVQQQEQMPQVFQQVVAADGTVQHVPLQLTPQQLQKLQMVFSQHQQVQQRPGSAALQQQQQQQPNQQQATIFLQTSASQPTTLTPVQLPAVEQSNSSAK